MRKFVRLRGFARKISDGVTPSQIAWRGAATGVLVVSSTVVVAYFVIYFVQDFAWTKLPAFAVRVGVPALLGLLLLVGIALVSRLPSNYRVAVFLSAPFIFLSFAPGNDGQAAGFTAIVLLITSFIGAGVAVIRRDGFHPRAQIAATGVLILGLGGLLGGLYAVFSPQESANPLLDNYILKDQTLSLANPGLAGNYEVKTISYGSGEDRHREEFGAGVGIRSRSVDGRKLIDNWEGVSGWLRTRYWGFDATQLPLQARVWYPSGHGPFPLVLVVHGNHSMEDFSDPGYAYLGELFASRGIILASVDENFVNSSISAAVDVMANRPGLEEENDARGWLLLQHLSQWRDWNNESGHPFYRKVDIDRVALIGHSRGGEAVAVAAAFNTLSRYPDDATLEFEFDFNLRGVISIAPVDGQYRPRENGTPIRDVNYFTIHGSMDGDVQSFDGTAQYSRVSFSGEPFRFKASLYVDGANHGQFNTTWGNTDTSLYRAWTLDTARIMDGEAQRDVARVFFSAFLEVVLRDRVEYLPIFADARKAAGWLPTQFFISQFAASNEIVIADFEEDIDPSTATIRGSSIDAQHLSKWYEVQNSLKYAGRISKHTTHAAVFAWDKEFHQEAASVRFLFAESGIVADEQSIFIASISDAGVGTLPGAWDSDENDGSISAGDTADVPLDWTVRLTDTEGNMAELLLSYDEALYPQVQAIPRRASFLDDAEPAEVLYRRFEFRVADFVDNNPGLHAGSLSSLAFVFDQSDKGAIIVDDLSIVNPER